MKRYEFIPNDACKMCGGDHAQHRVIGQRLNASQGLNPARLSGISIAVQKCGSCGLISPNPLPIPDKLSDHYGVPPEDYWAQAKFEEVGLPLENEVRKAKELIGPRDSLIALDIGAGLGRVLNTLEHYGFEAHGLEPSEPFFDFARSNLNIPADRLKMVSLEDADYPPGSFDFITFGAVLEHLYDPGHALEKALGWLRPNGIIQVEVPSSRHLVAKLVNAYFRLRGTRFVTNISPMHSPFHIYEFDLESFRKHGIKAHYVVQAHEYRVCQIFHLPRSIHPLLRAWMKATNTGMQLTVYLRKN